MACAEELPLLSNYLSLQCLRCFANSSNLSSTMFCPPENTEASSNTKFVQFFPGRPLHLLLWVGVHLRRYIGIRVYGILETCPNQRSRFAQIQFIRSCFKHCDNNLCHPLSQLFTSSYDTGYILREWKLDKILPVHKKGSKKQCLVMKTFKRIMMDEF